MGVNGIYGLSGSGMDIESMVKVGMMSKQNEYDKMAQKYTKNEWTKSAYIELNNNINTFNLSTLSQYKMSSNMNAKTAESNSSAVKVDANASAGVMPHRVAVESLSTNAYLISTNKITRANTSAKTSLNLKDILFNNLEEYKVDSDEVDDENQPIMVGNGKVKGEFKGGNGTTYTFSQENYDNKELTNQKGPAAALTDTAIRFFIGDGTKDDDGNLKTVEISYTYGEILNENVTINDLVSKINNAGLNIKASFDTVNEKFSIYNSKGGKDNTIYLAAGDNTFTKDGSYADGSTYTTTTSNFAGSVATTLLHGLGLQMSANGSLSGKNLEFQNRLAANTVTGTDGIIKVDGVEYKTTDNKVTAGGITYTALDTTPANQMATVTVSQNVDAIVDKVKSFVADYNKLLAGLYEKYDEKPDSNYKPLTQSQKDAMKEEQITKWEEKAKKGLLYHDQTIGKIITEMRDAISSPVESIEGTYNSAYSIGISTTGLKGQLVLDEDKLRKALNADADSVYNIFAKLDTSQKDKAGNVIDNPDGNGIAQRLGDVFTAATKAIKSRAGSSESITEDSDLNTLLRQLQTKMSNFKKLMASFEDQLYKKYDSMETTLAKLGAQLSFITGGQ